MAIRDYTVIPAVLAVQRAAFRAIRAQVFHPVDPVVIHTHRKVLILTTEGQEGRPFDRTLYLLRGAVHLTGDVQMDGAKPPPLQLTFSVTCDNCGTTASTTEHLNNFDFMDYMRGQKWQIPSPLEHKPILCPTCRKR